MKKISIFLSVSTLAFLPINMVFAQSDSDTNAAEAFMEELLDQTDPATNSSQAQNPETIQVMPEGSAQNPSESSQNPSESAQDNTAVELVPVPSRQDNLNTVEVTVPDEPAPSPVTIIDTDQAPEVPPQDSLSTVQPIVTGAAPATIVPPPGQGNFALPTIQKQETPNIDEGLFFDSESTIPQSQQAAKGTIRNVSPRTEPASKYVVVNKTYSADSRKAQIVSAQRALKLGRYESALDMFNELYAKDHRNQDVMLGRAVALQKLGRDDAAVQAYEELLNENPNNVEASINMVGIIGQRYPEVASRRLLDLKEKNPNNVAVLSQLAVIEGNMGRYDQALRYLGIASGLQPKNASHLYNMAVVSDRAGDTKMAVQYYEQALELDAIHGGSRSVPREAIFSRLSQIR